MQLCGIFEIKRGKSQQTFFSHTKSVNKMAIFVALHDLNHLSIAPRRVQNSSPWRSLSFRPRTVEQKKTCERSRKSAAAFRADLDGTIFPYDCSMRLAHVMPTTRIVSSKSTYNIFTTVANNEKNFGNTF